MNSVKLSRIAFAASAIYDLLLGLTFLIFPVVIFQQLQLPDPGHWGYVQFPAALLIVFAIMFFKIAKDPIGRIDLMPYGIMLKVAYMIVVFGHWFFATVPTLWKPFAIIDLLFLLAFAWCYLTLQPVKLRHTDPV